MLAIVVRRMAQTIPVLFGVSLLVFAWVRALPGGPAEALVTIEDRGSPEATTAIRRAYGLDRPLAAQYATHLRQLVSLDLGQSIVTRQDVTTELRQRIPATVELAAAAMVVAVGVGVPLGLVSAGRWRGWFDHLSLGVSVVALSVPSFFLGFVLKYVFSVKLGWLPATGRMDALRDAAHPTGFYGLDAVVTRDGAAFVDAVRHLVLPAFALGAAPAAFIARLTRVAVLEAAGEDYVRTAYAKGLTRLNVELRHMLRNALLPLTTAMGLLTGTLLSGAVLIEVVFAWGGIGSLLQQAISSRDYAVLQGTILFVTVVFLAVNLLVDLSYAALNPRVRVR